MTRCRLLLLPDECREAAVAKFGKSAPTFLKAGVVRCFLERVHHRRSIARPDGLLGRRGAVEVRIELGEIRAARIRSPAAPPRRAARAWAE